MFLDVDEAGVKAAAATAVVIAEESDLIPVRVVVDRPFMFLIYDTVNNIPVFLGRIADPTQ